MRSHRRQQTRSTWREISLRRRFWMVKPEAAASDEIGRDSVPTGVRHRIAGADGYVLRKPLLTF